MLEIDQQGFAAAYAEGARVIDVREPHEYVTGHVPGAQLIPLRSVASSVGQIEGSGTVYVICATGNRSKTAARTLIDAGLVALSVQGGTAGWIAAGHPVVQGPNALA
ncbi:rhodanese-like domain-containing protein [Actinotalea sp.]|uniref:rhodanese-like domain-containing protein n=1 Tax=Actinotalea sp. TaxID=1872145 RepID=UPI00356B44B1